MNRKQRSRRTPVRLAFMVAALAGLAAPRVRAQERCEELPIELPTPEVTISPGFEANEIAWAEIEPPLGRAVANVALENWVAANSSIVDLLGEYELDCDFRLTLRRVSEPTPGFGQILRFAYLLELNTRSEGAPFATDTLTIADAGVAYNLDPSLARDLSLRVSSNITQPTESLGTIPVTVSGLNTTNNPSRSYFVRAVDTGSVPGIRVEVRGPYATLPPPPSAKDTTFVVTAIDQEFEIMQGMRISFGAGSAAPGDSVEWSANHVSAPGARIIADLNAFEGYHVWRSDLPSVNEFTLLGEIVQCESKKVFNLINEDDEIDIELDYDDIARVFQLIDRDVHNDFPYRYAVSTFDRFFLGNLEDLTCESGLDRTEKVYPARQARSQSEKAFVVPNPYKRSSPWEEGSRKVVFANLPTSCTIRIFTTSADHVATLEHGPSEPRSTSPTSATWDLRSAAGEEIVPGIYIYYIDGTNTFEAPAETGGTITSTEQFQQTGKMIVVR